MSTFDKIKSKLESKGVNLVEGPITNAVKSACTNIDSAIAAAEVAATEAVESADKVIEDVGTLIANELKENSKSDPLYKKLELFYEKRYTDNSPVASLFDGKNAYLNFYDRNKFCEWWKSKTTEDISGSGRSPEFHIFQHKTSIEITILEFLTEASNKELYQKVTTHL